MRFIALAVIVGALLGRFLIHKPRHPLVYQGGKALGTVAYLHGEACIKKAGHWERIRF